MKHEIGDKVKFKSYGHSGEVIKCEVVGVTLGENTYVIKELLTGKEWIVGIDWVELL